MPTPMVVPQRRELNPKSRENSLEISQHEIVPRVPHCVAVHLQHAHARHRVHHVIGDATSGRVYEPLYGAEQPVQSVFVVVFDAFKLAFVRVGFVDCQ